MQLLYIESHWLYGILSKILLHTRIALSHIIMHLHTIDTVSRFAFALLYILAASGMIFYGAPHSREQKYIFVCHRTSYTVKCTTKTMPKLGVESNNQNISQNGESHCFTFE